MLFPALRRNKDMSTTRTGAKAHQPPVSHKPRAARTLAFLPLLILPWLFMAGGAAAHEIEVQAAPDSDEAQGIQDLEAARKAADPDEAGWSRRSRASLGSRPSSCCS